jgi:hypothetical protein
MIQASTLLSTTTNTTGAAVLDKIPGGTFQATITGTGTVGVTVTVQASLDATNWVTLGTITLSGTTTATDGFVSLGEWVAYRAITASATGTIASINVLMSEVS